MATYSWLPLSTAIGALQTRLGSSVFWPSAECQGYLTQALHEYNALTEQWKLPFTFPATSATPWYNTGLLAGSPRLRTLTDATLYSMMQGMLLEPQAGAGTWTGTNQFTLAQMQFALQRRRDEVIQATGCNIAQLSPLPSIPNTVRTVLADTVLEPRRIRFVPATGFGSPITLTREDTQAFQFFVPGYLGGQPSTAGPLSWSVASEPPLAFDVDNAPFVPGSYDMVALNAGPTFAPPASTLLGVPDDWAYVPMWGALADLLGGESEQTDRERSAYCLNRYNQGIQIMRQSNWLVNANINGVPCDTPSVFEMDIFSPEWQGATSSVTAATATVSLSGGTGTAWTNPSLWTDIGAPGSGTAASLVISSGAPANTQTMIASSLGFTVPANLVVTGISVSCSINLASGSGVSGQFATMLNGANQQTSAIASVTAGTATYTANFPATPWTAALLNGGVFQVSLYLEGSGVLSQVYANNLVVVVYSSISTSAWPTVVQAGTDLVGVCPVANASVGLILVGNAPILDVTGTYVQVSRDDWAVVLNYAQRLATFKMGGKDFSDTAEFEKDFYRAAQFTNKRLLDMGIFTQQLNSEGLRQDEMVPRGEINQS